MSYKGVLTKIDELRAIVGSWRDDADPALLEMDMALERVKAIYEMLRFPASEPEVEPTAEVAEVAAEAEVEVAVEPIVEAAEAEPVAEEQVVEEQVAEAEPEVMSELEPEPEPEPTIEPEPIAEVESESEPESIADEEELLLELVNVTQIAGGALDDGEMIDKASFDREIAAMAQKKRERLNKILSLYSDGEEQEESEQEQPQESEPMVEQEAQPVIVEEAVQEVVEVEMPQTKPEPEPVVEAPQSVVEVAGTEPEFEESQPVMKFSINLGLNDRILLLQELFDGDEAELQRVMGILEQMTTIDDAMIYIAENHTWSGDNEGAQLLMSLLQNRYQI